ncbi:uncharacterized protein Aud_001232 [Aspergillus udagawae]|uniref:Uncharacterized protein n=1 Tax=Aspergillus udagawae TaxID=91492 RepID=A0A8E0QLU5_9EURO|nr:uncharacterized protein Aud_001232 [Aspergillus udagawae]GIC85401.1 hypothetical protein Aud_001232 [Aspergillus udagawae]
MRHIRYAINIVEKHPVEILSSGKSFRIWIASPYNGKDAHIVLRHKISLIQEFNGPVFTTSIVMDSRIPQFFFYHGVLTDNGVRFRALSAKNQDLYLTVASKLGGIAIRQDFYETIHRPAIYGQFTREHREIVNRLEADADSQLKKAFPHIVRFKQPSFILCVVVDLPPGQGSGPCLAVSGHAAQQQESPFDRPSPLPAVRHPPPFDQATSTTADASLSQELFPLMLGVIGVRGSW